jgi:Flp pilus assembly protein TadD
VLWSKTVEQGPKNSRARQSPAEAKAELGRLHDAIEKPTAAVRLRADESTYHDNLALVRPQANRLDKAVLHYRHALRLVPTEARTHHNPAIALDRAGRGASALPHYAEAERLKPTEPPFAENHGGRARSPGPGRRDHRPLRSPSPAAPRLRRRAL